MGSSSLNLFIPGHKLQEKFFPNKAKISQFHKTSIIIMALQSGFIPHGSYSLSFISHKFDSLRPLNNLSVMRDVSSWVEPVLS